MKKLIYVFLIGIVAISLTSCKNSTSKDATIVRSSLDSLVLLDQINFFSFKDVLLGDGVPLGVDLAVRWKVTDAKLLLSHFNSITSFKNDILKVRGRELMNEAFNEFESIDSVFHTKRPAFIARLKEVISTRLGEEGIEIKEVICKQIYFPTTYTKAMEQVGLQRQEMERINQSTIIAIAKAEADTKKAEAFAKVKIAEAKAADRIEQINAKTEKSRRASQLAAAETQKQIQYKKAQSESDRLKLLAKTDLTKARDIKKLEIEHEKDRINVEVDRKKKMDMADFEIQMEMASVFQKNPVYASYLVNKEMASKVKIAVLPTGTDPNVFGGLLNQMIPVKATNN